MKAEDINPNRFVLDTKGAADLRLKLKQDPQAGLKQAAQQFEGMLLQVMLKSMRDAAPQDGLMDNEQTRFFTSILDQQLAQNLSSKGQLGFAKLIEQQMGRNLLSSGSNNDTVSSSLSLLQQVILERQAASSAASLAASGAGSALGTSGVSSVPTTESTVSGRDFVNRVWPHAVEAGNSLGVPPHFLVAHSALESGWGKSEIRTPDGSPTYNIFGVKAGRSWQGASVEIPTTEYVNGVPQTVREKFRAYGSYGEAFRDYASLLGSSSRFSGILGQQDGTQFARTLQQSGYATDPQYADKLSRIINGATLRQALVG